MCRSEKKVSTDGALILSSLEGWFMQAVHRQTGLSLMLVKDKHKW